jgi:hypothetical protein
MLHSKEEEVLMRKDHRRQIAMRRDLSWQNARARQKALQPGRTIRPLLTALLALVIIATVATGIMIWLHTSTGSGQGAATRSHPASPIPVGSQGAQAPVASQIRTGVFTLSDGGPIPVPANVLKPVNLARTVLNNEVYSIYAGALTRQPEIGALAVLQENLQSGRQSLHTYQSPRHEGTLTIQSLQQNIVIFSAADGGQGRFNLFTGQFQFA